MKIHTDLVNYLVAIDHLKINEVYQSLLRFEDCHIQELLTNFYVNYGEQVIKSSNQVNLDLLTAIFYSNPRTKPLIVKALIALTVKRLMNMGFEFGADFSLFKDKLVASDAVKAVLKDLNPVLAIPMFDADDPDQLRRDLEYELGTHFIENLLSRMVQREEELNQSQLNLYLFRIYNGVHNKTGINIEWYDCGFSEMRFNKNIVGEPNLYWVIDPVESAKGTSLDKDSLFDDCGELSTIRLSQNDKQKLAMVYMMDHNPLGIT